MTDRHYIDWWRFEGVWYTGSWNFGIGIAVYPAVRVWVDIGPLTLVLKVAELKGS